MLKLNIYASIHHLMVLTIQGIEDYKWDGTMCQGGLVMEKTICELFAGVGGFRIGFDRLCSGWETTWFSQWEPGKKKQWAYDC